MGNICCCKSKEDAIVNSVGFFNEQCIKHKTPVYERNIICADHSLCSKCELESFYKQNCIHCYKLLTTNELETIRQKAFTDCDICKKNEISAEKADCGCFICINCIDVQCNK